jgi:NADPH:quinone reductase-like Zn-dependent oxidoreductase
MSRAVGYSRNGPPLDVAEIRTCEIASPGPGEAIVQVEAAPIHLADLFYMDGKLANLASPPPAISGIEGFGRIVEIGDRVTGFGVGDRVLLPRRSGTFTEFMRLSADRLIKAPDHGDPVQLSLVPVNAATSHILLTRVVPLRPGDWLIQNAANSSCGRFNIGIARELGLRTVNVVRRPDLIPELQALGADIVLLDGDDLDGRVGAATGGAPMPFAIDAVAGMATARLARCLSQGGTIVSYGMMSGEPCMIPPDLLFTMNLTLKGFLTPHYETDMTWDDKVAIAQQLALAVADGRLKAKIAATYPLDRFKDAIRHEMETGQQRDGKVVLLPNA